jgi:hypothetical protein
MALNASGAISLAGTTAGQSIALELGLGTSTQISLNDAAVRTLAGVASGAITMPTNFWGKSNHVPLSTKVTFTANSTFTVPSGISLIRVKAWGAAGGWNFASSVGTGGGGGFARGDVTVTSGNTLLIAVGGGGGNGTGGTNGGGNNTAGNGVGGGGGYSGVFVNNLATQANARVMAGGGGGSFNAVGRGGAGGGSVGQRSGSGTGNCYGGTQSAGGAGFGTGTAGIALKGGTGTYGGGGGGGYFGGGGSGGIGNSGGGGGGSGYVISGATNVTLTTGSNASVANSADSDYVAGKGNGVAGAGQPGYVVLYW